MVLESSYVDLASASLERDDGRDGHDRRPWSEFIVGTHLLVSRRVFDE